MGRASGPPQIVFMPLSFPGLPDDIQIKHQVHDDWTVKNWMHILSVDEMQRRTGMRSEKRQQNFTLGRVAIRTLLSDHMQISPSEVPIVIEPTGRLSAPESGQLLSLAHSGDQAIASISMRNAGVDVEEIREKPDSLLDYILCEEEKKHVYGLSIPHEQLLFVCWTLKEAVLKANGTGLRRSPRTVQLRIDPISQTATAVDPEGNPWHARFVVEDPYVFAIAFDPNPDAA